jgi:type III secretory pathway lipoprotein EscJ
MAISCGDKEIISTKDMNEANKMMVALKEGNISSSRTESGEGDKIKYSLFVSDGFFSTGAEIEAMRILQENCLPYTPPPEIIDGGMVPSATSEGEKRKRQAQIDLEQLFRGYKNVTCVKAILVYPEKSIDNLNPYPSSATIRIGYKAQNPVLTKEAVQNQTARAVEKLDPALVDVQLEYSEVKPAEINAADSWKKLLITAGVSVALIGLLMIIVLWMRGRKPNEEEFDDDPDLIEENELNLLEAGEDE